MRVFCSGFNLYGQFIKHTNLIVGGFIDWLQDEVTGLELSQTFTIIFKENDVYLLGAKNIKTHQIQKLVKPETLNIVQASCTEQRILFLSSDGLLFKVDVKKDNELILTALPNIILNESKIENDVFIKISCGSKINVALSKQGKLFNLPNKLRFENGNIIDICTGREHCLILDSEGNVHSFGSGSRGQLGHGNLENELEPKLIEALAGIKISKIAAGGWHSCAISEEGDLYIWGWNGNGQLGIGYPNEEAVSIMAVPHVVVLEDVNKESLNFVVVNVACGNRHTIVLLDDGKLFGAGWNKYHQLGSRHVDKENLYAMTFLHDFSTLAVSDLKCGPWSSVVIVN